jgi:hypothetical protein
MFAFPLHRRPPAIVPSEISFAENDFMTVYAHGTYSWLEIDMNFIVFRHSI